MTGKIILGDSLWQQALPKNITRYLKIWSSSRYCFRPLVKAADDSESRPKGFSTITLVQPLAEEADVLADFTTFINIFGGMDR